jgi:hypothetical protein
MGTASTEVSTYPGSCSIDVSQVRRRSEYTPSTNKGNHIGIWKSMLVKLFLLIFLYFSCVPEVSKSRVLIASPSFSSISAVSSVSHMISSITGPRTEAKQKQAVTRKQQTQNPFNPLDSFSYGNKETRVRLVSIRSDAGLLEEVVDRFLLKHRRETLRTIQNVARKRRRGEKKGSKP